MYFGLNCADKGVIRTIVLHKLFEAFVVDLVVDFFVDLTFDFVF